MFWTETFLGEHFAREAAVEHKAAHRQAQGLLAEQTRVCVGERFFAVSVFDLHLQNSPRRVSQAGHPTSCDSERKNIYTWSS